ncbi:MAG TPA: elongation factor G [Pirellulales bacterium]|jgi:elongation factor G|nr:elongation factor G [Pirellulales bacterium]
MAKHQISDIRNIAFCGHGSSGKTTLIDKMLNMTGAVSRPASVDDKTSICDFDDEEKHHKYTVEAKLVHFQHAGKRFNVIDTPGYPDFIGQAIAALRAVDTAAIVINAHNGIEVNTRRMFQEAGKAGLGRVIIVNKLDTDNIDFPALIKSIKEMFGNECIPLDLPVGISASFKSVVDTLHPPQSAPGVLLNPQEVNQQLVEDIVEVDEIALAHYFEGEPPTDEEIPRLEVEAVATGHLIPIICVSAKTGVGFPELLDALAACALPPDKVRRKAHRDDGTEVDLPCDPNGPLVAQIFKTRIDPFVQKISYARLFSGAIKKDDTVHVSKARKPVKLTAPMEVQASETHPIDSAAAGDIVAFIKLEDLHTGVTLGELSMPPIVVPTPMVGLAALPKNRGDETKLSGALHKILEEDLTFRLEHDRQTHEMVMTGMSELHLGLIREKLKRRDKVEIDVKEPKIPYRETIQQKAEGSYRHKKQSGGRGQFGEVHIRMFPFPAGTDPAAFCTKERFPHLREYRHEPEHNFLWVDSVVGGTIPNNFLPAIEKGFKERLERGVIAGYQVQDIGVEVHFGKHHPVDSSEAAFKIAGAMAFRNVFLEAKPSLLEPMVNLHVTVPSAKLGDINADMSGRRGRVLGMESSGGDLQTVTAVVPLSEVTTYARSLSSMTGGQGSYTMDFSHYDLVPGNVQKEIVEKAAHKDEMADEA